MRRIRDVLRLKFAQGLSERAIAGSLGLGKGSVGAYLRRAREAGLSWPLPEGLDDDSLELLLFPASPTVPDPDRPVPDWSVIDKELRRRGVTRMLLWQEYRAQHPGGFGYTWFCTQHPLHQLDLQLFHQTGIAKQIFRARHALQQFV